MPFRLTLIAVACLATAQHQEGVEAFTAPSSRWNTGRYTFAPEVEKRFHFETIPNQQTPRSFRSNFWNDHQQALSSSTALGALLEKVEIDPEAREDDGPTPTAEDWARIEEYKSNINFQRKLLRNVSAIITVLFRQLRNLLKRITPGFGSDYTNSVVYGVYETLRNATPIMDSDLDPLNFTNDIRHTLFYQTKKNVLRSGSVSFIYPILRRAPDMETEAGTPNYTALYGNKIQAYGRGLKSKDALDCFLKLSPAFVAPEEPGSSRMVCDLRYLSKYQVDKGTPGTIRYGGKAVMEHGEIVEITMGATVASTPGSEQWEEHLWIFLASFAVHFIVDRHAVMAHLAITQRLLIKLTTNISERYENAWTTNFGPQRLLQALTTRCNEVALNEQLLIGPGNSLVARATSFTNDSLVLMCGDRYNVYSTMTPQEQIDDVAQKGDAKWSAACQEAFEGAEKAVRIICDPLVKSAQSILSEADIQDLSLMLWTSTFYHEFIGDFTINALTVGHLPLLLTGKPHVQNLSYGTLSTTIAVTVATRTCNMETLGAFFPEPEQRTAWKEYENLLKNLDTGIEGLSYESPIYNAVNF